MSQTISASGGKPKNLYGYMTVGVTPMERMYIEYYAAKYNKDRGEVLRGTLHKYVELDETFDHAEFVKWIDKTFLPNESDKDLRKLCKEKMAAFREVYADEIKARSQVDR